MDTSTAFAALYRQLVLDHGRAPRQVGVLTPPARRARAHNPLCGDRIELSLRLDGDGRVVEVRHRSEGCLLCIASASLLAERVQGLDAAQVAPLVTAVQAAVTGVGAPDASLGEVAALAGVAAYPARRRCALLPWEALTTALAGGDEASP